MKSHQWFWLIGVLTLGFVLMAHPAIWYSEPIVQSDGISYYGYAKTFAETLDINAPNPEWNKPLAYGLVQTLLDYPPLTSIALGLPLLIVGHDIVWLNGLYGAFLLTFHLFFLFLLLKKITKSTNWSIIGTLIGALNLRLYFLFFAGILPTALGVVLTTPALYFLWCYMEKKNWSDLVIGALFTFLLGIAYPQQTWLFAVIMISLALGKFLEQKFDFNLKLPKITVRKESLKPWTLIPAGIVVLVSIPIFLHFALRAKVTNSFVSDFINGMLFTLESAYPRVWKMPFLFDGPILFLLAIAGCIILLYQQRFRLLMPILGTSLTVYFAVAFIPDVWVRVYFFRYFAELSIFLGIAATVALQTFWREVKLRREVVVVTSLVVLIAFVKLLAFFTFVTPAVTPDEMRAAEFVKDRTGSVMYYNNIEQDANFRDFYWVVAISEPEVFHYGKEFVAPMPYDIVVVGDGSLLSSEERSLLQSRKETRFGVVSVFE